MAQTRTIAKLQLLHARWLIGSERKGSVLDEAGGKTNLSRLGGARSARQTFVHQAPAGHWQAATLISSIRLDGSTACMAVGAATNTEVFRSYIEEILLPTLCPGDIVVMDNLTAHKNEQTLALIKAKGAQALFLPPFRRILTHRKDVEQDQEPAAQHRGPNR